MDAFWYPLGRVYDEANLVTEREANRVTTEATLMQIIVQGILSQKSRAEFTKRIKSLSIEVKPIAGLFGPRE